MAWIAMRTDLADDPAVLRLRELLGLDAFSVVGVLHRVWSWADTQLRDGNASGVTPALLERAIGVTGVCDALVEVGWLQVLEGGSGGIAFPNFDRWNRQTTKARLLTARRVETHRKRRCNAPSVTQPLPQNRTEQSSSNARARAIPGTPDPAPDSTTAAADQGQEDEADPDPKREACLAEMRRHGLDLADYLLEEFPDTTPELVRLALKGVSSGAGAGARVTHFRKRMPKVLQEAQQQADAERRRRERDEAERRVREQEDERSRARWAEIDAMLATLDDDGLAALKGRAIAGASNDFEAGVFRRADPAKHPALRSTMARLLAASDQTGGEFALGETHEASRPRGG